MNYVPEAAAEFFAALPETLDDSSKRKLVTTFMQLPVDERNLRGKALEQLKNAPSVPRGKLDVPLATRLGTFGNGLPEINIIGWVVQIALGHVNQQIAFWEHVVGKE